MTKLFNTLTLCFILISSASFIAFAGKQKKQDDELLLHVHNVGQGNCVTVKYDDHYIVLDAGTSAFKEELKYTATQKPFIPFESKELLSFSLEEESYSNESGPSFVSTPKDKKKGSIINEEKEIVDTSQELDIETSLDTSLNLSPIKQETSTESIIESPNFKGKGEDSSFREEEEESIDELEIPHDKKLLVKKIRANLGEAKPRTVVVSHPDKDHYNLLPILFESGDSEIKHIILAGLPQMYFTEESIDKEESKEEVKEYASESISVLKEKGDAFKDWLIKQIMTGSKIYFPSIKFNKLILKIPYDITQKSKKTTETERNTIEQEYSSSQDNINIDEISKWKNELIKYIKKNDETVKKSAEISIETDYIIEEILNKLTTSDHIYAPQAFGDINQYKEALALGSHTKLIPLSINPTHYTVNKGKVLKTTYLEDTNSDSLVLKVAHYNVSATITGDATSLTMQRIENNYIDHEGFLKTNFLLASHHGAESHGSNSQHSIQLMAPEYILISNGHMYGHPRHGAYEAFKTSPSLLKVQSHRVLVGDKPRTKEGELRTTKRAIFSTLNSGTLTAILSDKDEVKLRTEKDGEISLKIEEDKQQEDLESSLEVKLEESFNKEKVFVRLKQKASKS